MERQDFALYIFKGSCDPIATIGTYMVIEELAHYMRNPNFTSLNIDSASGEGKDFSHLFDLALSMCHPNSPSIERATIYYRGKFSAETIILISFFPIHLHYLSKLGFGTKQVSFFDPNKDKEEFRQVLFRFAQLLTVEN